MRSSIAVGSPIQGHGEITARSFALLHLGQRTPRQREPTADSETAPVLRLDRLGGVLHEYFREAA